MGRRSGTHWHDLSERYGKWKSVHWRFSRWSHAGVWARIFAPLTSAAKSSTSTASSYLPPPLLI